MAEKNLILEIKIDIYSDKVVGLEGRNGAVKMIPFGGTVSGKIFNGIVEPCGVDTQVTNLSDVRHMSARYMLTGTDFAGQECHIYVENNGWFTDGAFPAPFKTVPTFITDSEALTDYLSGRHFTGEGARGEDGLVIRFYDKNPVDKSFIIL